MTVLTDAYVLKKSQRGDFDRQYALYTRDLGKITVLAKGAMKISSKLAPHLEFFYLTEVMVALGRSFYRLAGAKIKTAYLKNDDDRFKKNAACFFLETADILMLEKHPDSGIFETIDNFFIALSAAENSQKSHLALNQSLFELLSRLGYQPKLTAKNQTQLTYDFHRQILAAGEREVRSFACLRQELDCLS